MATVIAQRVHHLGFFENYIFYRIAANLPETNTDYAFTRSSRKILKNRKRNRTVVKSKRVERNLSKIHCALNTRLFMKPNGLKFCNDLTSLSKYPSILLKISVHGSKEEMILRLVRMLKNRSQTPSLTEHSLSCMSSKPHTCWFKSNQ